jgi:hypothetical protein
MAIEKSGNIKIGEVSATYASQETCPSSCPFQGSGCYAESGPMAIHTKRLNTAAKGQSLQTLADNEALAIRELSGVRPLRLHVVGDCTTDAGASTVSAAASEYRAKHGQSVWSYTHAWRNVSRQSWRDVSVLASCETIADTKDAMAKGFGAAIVVEYHDTASAKVVDGVRVIPCPQQTGKAANCLSCKLCMNADRLRDTGAVIAFATHGSGVKKANKALLNVIQ